MQFEETNGRFGFHLKGGRDERYPSDPAVRFYVRSSALSRLADLAISAPLATEAEIDRKGSIGKELFSRISGEHRQERWFRSS